MVVFTSKYQDYQTVTAGNSACSHASVWQMRRLILSSDWVWVRDMKEGLLSQRKKRHLYVIIPNIWDVAPTVGLGLCRRGWLPERVKNARHCPWQLRKVSPWNWLRWLQSMSIPDQDGDGGVPCCPEAEWVSSVSGDPGIGKSTLLTTSLNPVVSEWGLFSISVGRSLPSKLSYERNAWAILIASLSMRDQYAECSRRDRESTRFPYYWLYQTIMSPEISGCRGLFLKCVVTAELMQLAKLITLPSLCVGHADQGELWLGLIVC